MRVGKWRIPFLLLMILIILLILLFCLGARRGHRIMSKIMIMSRKGTADRLMALAVPL